MKRGPHKRQPQDTKKQNDSQLLIPLNDQDSPSKTAMSPKDENTSQIDLNDLESNPLPIRESTGFPPSIYEQLPPLLKEACNFLPDATEKEVFLIGALGVISGTLPQVFGFYDGKVVGPNLFTFVLAKYGTGKGALTHCKAIGAEIHKALKAETEEAMKDYLKDIAEYRKELKKFNQEERKEPPTEPEKPPQLLLFIPANNSKTGLYQLLDENDGRGILFETEGDTLADAIRQDYGNFSDGLRKAFQHEPIDFFRRTGNEYTEIETPFLSVVISSTMDQLRNLIPTAENGLFSRFLFYELEPSTGFRNVFDPQRNKFATYFSALSHEVKEIYDNLRNRENHLFFELEERHQEKFLNYFQTQKDEMCEFVSEDFTGSVNRLGLITFRISMIFAALRNAKQLASIEKLVCNDQDFTNSVAIVEVLFKHAVSIFDRLPKATTNEKEESPDIKAIEKAGLIEQCRKLRMKQNLSFSKIATMVLGDPKMKSKVYRWCKGIK